ncbi:MAG: tetratricopeptide repeat protein, partial [Verrucomicrobiota bacterium]
MNAGRFAEAEQVLEEVLGASPGWSVGWLNLGLCRIRLRQGDAAMRALEEGLRLDPVRPRVRLSLADAAILQGRPDRAIDWCREECRQFPGETGSWMALGMAFERVDHPEAGEAYREALRLSPGDPGVVAHLGRWLHHQHDLDSAKSLLDPLHRHHPHQGRLQWQWAVNCFLRGDVTRGL